MTGDHVNRDDFKLNAFLVTYWPFVVIVSALAVFVFFQLIISHVSGWWLDELFSLWASDPAISFKEAFVQRIAPDTNPPAYYAILYWMRHFVGNDRTAVITINTVFLAGAAIVSLAWAKRASLVRVATLSISLFLLSGSVARYFSEGRAYLGALAIVFVASWLAAQSTYVENDRQPTVAFMLVGVLAALIHLYAALFCCALAAGLIIVAVTDRNRRALLKSGVALGATAAGASGVWILTILHSMGNFNWIQFNWHGVFNAAMSVFGLGGGPICGAIVLTLIPMYGLKRANVRPLVILFATTYILFIVLPILVSFKKPIITGRYWTIGSPGMVVLISFLLVSWFSELLAEARPTGWQRAVLRVVLLGAVSIIWGLSVAYQNLSTKTIWKGGELVKPLINGCPDQSIHVGSYFNVINGKKSLNGAFVPGFTYLTGANANIFVPVIGEETPNLALHNARCPVLGWAESLNSRVVKTATDEELLHLLRIDASTADVDVRRQRNGFVVLRH